MIGSTKPIIDPISPVTINIDQSSFVKINCTLSSLFAFLTLILR